MCKLPIQLIHPVNKQIQILCMLNNLIHRQILYPAFILHNRNHLFFWCQLCINRWFPHFTHLAKILSINVVFIGIIIIPLCFQYLVRIHRTSKAVVADMKRIVSSLLIIKIKHNCVQLSKMSETNQN